MTPNDPTRVREEKARLYQSAVEAWEKGEVTAALGKLEELAAMDRDFPDPDAGRGSTYRNFYNQVHSESDAIKNAYDEARRQLNLGNLDGAMALCRQYLAKYPNHALFKPLKAEVEARQPPRSPTAAQAIVETERKANDEPDLERRAAILENTLRLYPAEPHLQNALQAVRDLREVVDSMIASARKYEEEGHFADALDQWQILKSIHPRQPGLAAAIERLTQRRDQPPPAPAPPAVSPLPAAPAAPAGKSEWAGHARSYLEVGDYQRAVQAINIGLGESPGNPELLALEDQVRQGQERANQALELLGKAHDTINKGSMDEGLDCLRRARDLDPRNSVIRTVLVNGLLDQARKKLDSDPSGADKYVQEILRIEPNHAQATILAQGLVGRKTAPPPAAPPIVPKATAPPGPPVSLPTRESPTIPLAVVTPGFPGMAAPPQPPPPTGVTATPPPPQIPPPVPLAATPPRPPRPPAPPGGHPKKLLFGTAAAVIVLVLIALGVTVLRHRAKPTPRPTAAAKYAVALHATPTGAEIKINGETCGISNCSSELAPGNYQVQAQMAGYQSATLPIVVGPGAPAEFNLTLNAQGPRASFFTDLAEGTVSLDDAAAGMIQGGGAEIDNLTAGKHVLGFKGGDSTATIPIEITAGAAPTLAGTIDAKNVRCFLLTGIGGSAHLYGSAPGYHLTLDNKPLGILSAAGMPLDGLAPGSHELVIDSDTGAHDRMDFEAQPAPSIYVSLGTAQNLGTLSVETNEDQVHLLINGQKYRRDTVHGRLVVYKSPGKYTVAVQKDGFNPSAQQTVEIKAGVDSKVAFTLTAAKSVLAVHHAPPGTDVQVDNISRGAVHSDGEFQVGGIDPGKHTVTLKHDGFKTQQSEQTFAPGKTVDLQAALESAPTTGTLRFEINPAGVDAHVRIKRDGEAQDREVTGQSVSVPEGHYLVTVSAPQYITNSASVQVLPGATVVAAMTLRRAEAKAPVKTGPAMLFGLEDWLKVPGWRAQNGTLVHKGGDWVMAPPDISQGTVRFTVVSMRGRHVEWAVAWRDDKNFIHYELDDKNLTRYEVRNGTKLGQVKLQHGLDKKKPMGISLAVSPQSVVLSIYRDGWLDLDKWEVEGSSVHGQFGFRIPGSDEIGLQAFQISR